MHVIVVGLGKLGITMTKQLITEGHSITVVDINNSKVTSFVDTYDVMGVCGNTADPDTLNEATAPHAKRFRRLRPPKLSLLLQLPPLTSSTFFAALSLKEWAQKTPLQE